MSEFTTCPATDTVQQEVTAWKGCIAQCLVPVSAPMAGEEAVHGPEGWAPATHVEFPGFCLAQS